MPELEGGADRAAAFAEALVGEIQSAVEYWRTQQLRHADVSDVRLDCEFPKTALIIEFFGPCLPDTKVGLRYELFTDDDEEPFVDERGDLLSYDQLVAKYPMTGSVGSFASELLVMLDEIALTRSFEFTPADSNGVRWAILD